MKHYCVSWVYCDSSHTRFGNAEGLISGDNPTYQDIDDWVNEIKESKGLEHTPTILFFKEIDA